MFSTENATHLDGEPWNFWMKNTRRSESGLAEYRPSLSLEAVLHYMLSNGAVYIPPDSDIKGRKVVFIVAAKLAQSLRDIQSTGVSLQQGKNLTLLVLLILMQVVAANQSRYILIYIHTGLAFYDFEYVQWVFKLQQLLQSGLSEQPEKLYFLTSSTIALKSWLWLAMPLKSFKLRKRLEIVSRPQALLPFLGKKGKLDFDCFADEVCSEEYPRESIRKTKSFKGLSNVQPAKFERRRLRSMLIIRNTDYFDRRIDENTWEGFMMALKNDFVQKLVNSNECFDQRGIKKWHSSTSYTTGSSDLFFDVLKTQTKEASSMSLCKQSAVLSPAMNSFNTNAEDSPNSQRCSLMEFGKKTLSDKDGANQMTIDDFEDRKNWLNSSVQVECSDEGSSSIEVDPVFLRRRVIPSLPAICERHPQKKNFENSLKLIRKHVSQYADEKELGDRIYFCRNTDKIDSGDVPDFVKDCINFILRAQKDLEEGLFRTSCDEYLVKELIKAYDRRERPLVEDVSRFDPCTVSAALKCYFRSIPNIRLSAEMAQSLIALSAATSDDAELAYQLGDRIIGSLSPQVFHTVGYLCHFLRFLSLQCSRITKMDAVNLAIVWVPALFSLPNVKVEKIESRASFQQLAFFPQLLRIFRCMIVQAPCIFPIEMLRELPMLPDSGCDWHQSGGVEPKKTETDGCGL